MRNFERTVERGLQDLATDVSPDAEERMIGRVGPMRRARRRSAIGALAVGAAAAVAAIVTVAISGVPGASNRDAMTAGESMAQADGMAQQPIGSGDSIELGKIGEPCPGASHASTIAGIRSATQVPVFAPADAQLTDAWTCGDTPVLMYGPIQISYEEGWSDVDVQQKWADLAQQTGGRVETLNGRSAYIHPPTSEGPRSGVMFVVDGTLVRLLAESDVPIGQLVALAKTIQFD